MDIIEIAKLSPPVIYLLGVVYLFKQNQDLTKDIKALVERYHTLVSEQVHTLGLLAEKLEAK